ncbi:MAG: DUF1549 domain-containing protein [Gemmataceae bacterium]
MPIRNFCWLMAVAVVPTVWAAPTAVELPGGRKIEQVDFERHVVALLGRMGCASGSCHGSFQGKGGLQLSLFGYDPLKDHYALLRDGHGRRVQVGDPEKSLLLLKATGQIEHGGLVRFNKSSWQYRLLRAWIEQGATIKPGHGNVKSVSIHPSELALPRPGTTGNLRVIATFADNSEEDVTALCDFRSNDDAVAEVDSLGHVKGLRAGDTAIVVSYRGTVLPVRVMVPGVLPPGFVYPQLPAVNFVDQEVFAKLKRLNIVPSELADDAEFLRRVTIDTIGALPSSDEVRAFLADKDPKKREKKIDALLRHPLHAALWATKFSDITGNNTDALENPPQRRPFLSQMWHDWFRKRIADNMPYDQIVKGVLTATSREGRSPEEYIKEVEAYEAAQDKGEKTTYAERATLDLFWRRQQRVSIEEWGEKTAAAFLGVRLECAQCHKHPFDRWTQADYRSYANTFASLSPANASPEAAKLFKEANTERAKRSQQAAAEAKRKGEKFIGLPIGPLREVFVAKPGKLLPDPDTNKPLPMRTLGGPEIKTAATADPREALWQWMRDKDNPFFARSFVNRVWAHYFGIGLVHPVDDFSLANPPSNPNLLDALAKQFVESGYNLRELERTILLSRTYQLSSVPNQTNRLDKNNYARGYIRPMMAEVVVDVLNDALGTKERWGPGEGHENARAIEVGASRVNNQNVNYVFRVFGRPPRTTACDCERAADPALPQKLFLLADSNLVQKLRTANNRVAQVLKAHKEDKAALEELFLATLSRYPTQQDYATFEKHKASKPKATRTELFTDTLWALINTSEFIFNH